jgi:mono/diheme cytochrome c family protein
MRTLTSILAASLAASLFLAACGGGDDEPTPTPQPAAPAAAQAEAPAAEPVAAAPVGDVEAGKQLYGTLCIACHGPEGKGVQGLGKDLTTSTFLADLDDAGVVEFLNRGRDAGDPLNTTGIAMPPKAGNPALTDQDMLNITAFLRTIHQ